MSIRAVLWALEEAPMVLTDRGKPDTTAHAVLVAMAERAHEDGTDSRQSILRLAYRTRFDVRTVSRAVGRLERAGLIRQAGVVSSGTKRWTLAMELRRPDSYEVVKALAEEAKRAESDARQGRRIRAAVEAVSGTQNPGHASLSGTQSAGQVPPVRDADSRRPALSVPASGTETPGVRDATPPEPSLNRPGTVLESGGTLPPDPLRRDDPPGRLNDQANSPPEGARSQLIPVGDPPHARARPRATCPTHETYLEGDGTCIQCPTSTRNAS